MSSNFVERIIWYINYAHYGIPPSKYCFSAEKKRKKQFVLQLLKELIKKTSIKTRRCLCVGDFFLFILKWKSPPIDLFIIVWRDVASGIKRTFSLLREISHNPRLSFTFTGGIGRGRNRILLMWVKLLNVYLGI